MNLEEWNLVVSKSNLGKEMMFEDSNGQIEQKNVGLDVELVEFELELKNEAKSRKFCRTSVELSVLPGPKCWTEIRQGVGQNSVVISVQPGPKP